MNLFCPMWSRPSLECLFGVWCTEWCVMKVCWSNSAVRAFLSLRTHLSPSQGLRRCALIVWETCMLQENSGRFGLECPQCTFPLKRESASDCLCPIWQSGFGLVWSWAFLIFILSIFNGLCEFHHVIYLLPVAYLQSVTVIRSLNFSPPPPSLPIAVRIWRSPTVVTSSPL